MILNAGLVLTILGVTSSIAYASPHAHRTRAALPDVWSQPEDSPVYDLFRSNLQKRQSNDTDDSPDVGSPTWAAQYPQGSVDVTKIPDEWTNALNAAVAAGAIPTNVPQTTLVNDNAVYPQGVNSQDPSICSANGGGTGSCRTNGSIWDAPDGYIGISFDDGPTSNSPTLYTFLQQNNQKATHFMIGTNILSNWQEFLTAYETLGDDIAVHTWTHPHMTSLSNVQVLAELAMTMQIIYDSTDGKLPRFWRPPYGDIDNRVNAIARNVLGLTAIIWNHDTDDYSIPAGGQTMDKVNSMMTQWMTGPKTPGLVILEHELYQETAQAFINSYPLLKQNGWNAVSVCRLFGDDAYQNGTSPDGETDGAFSVSTSTTSTSAAPSATENAAANNASSTGTASGASSSNSSPAILEMLAPSRSSMTAFASVVAALVCAFA
ncbi:glycoside hydrolase/deacetylase [Schizopora paradoxa]|uniref:chitin deacetylase n=1 Tax=Schizopora paradoxa TaxID=27342 RepID=A0A0H2RH90_9AGAM|nr:glycoside hydrolase/deacetylase [Schizopora paradoxa]